MGDQPTTQSPQGQELQGTEGAAQGQEQGQRKANYGRINYCFLKQQKTQF